MSSSTQPGRHILAAPAWPYANGPRHIGHVSGFALPCDMFSRYQRMAGSRVLMVSGTDEHGTPIQVQADAEGVSARQLADRYNRVIAEDLNALGMSYDLFTRTTTRNHYAVVQEIFSGLYRNGYIFPKVTLGAKSPSTGRTLPDRYIEGTCPICGYPSARGDQCDNCGNQLDPVDLIEPRSRINGETPEFVEEEHFFFDLPAFAEVLGSWLQTKRGQWRPNVLKFSLNLLDDLKPRAYTRDLDWGVPVPLDGWRDRPDAARPLHRGHLPHLRVPARARRPVRQLRQPAGPDRPDQPGVEDQRGDAEVRRVRALLPGPAGVRRGAGGLPADAGQLAAQRAQVLAQPAG